jgi:hypothetical protein
MRLELTPVQYVPGSPHLTSSLVLLYLARTRRTPSTPVEPPSTSLLADLAVPDVAEGRLLGSVDSSPWAIERARVLNLPFKEDGLVTTGDH